MRGPGAPNPQVPVVVLAEAEAGVAAGAAGAGMWLRRWKASRRRCGREGAR